MRIAVALFAAALSAVAADTARTFKNGKLEDKFWGFAYAGDGLQEMLAMGEPGLLFRGKLPGGIRLTIHVRESAAQRSADDWRREAKAGWRTRKLEDVAETGNRIVFVEPKLGVFFEEHGYAFHVRDHHCFVVHAWIADRTPGSRKAILAAIDALRPGPDPGCGLRVVAEALRSSKPALDPHVLLAAGMAYLEPRAGAPAVPALAARILKRASRVAKPDTFKPDARWQLSFHGGRALHAAGEAETAIGWLERATRTDDAAKAGQAGWHLARACAAVGRVDQAFAALDKAFRLEMPASKLQLSKDKALQSLRMDPRWEKFWKERVAGR